MRTIVQLHRHLSVLIVIVKLLLNYNWGLRTTLLAGPLRSEGRTLVGLEYDLVEWLEFVGVVYPFHGDAGLLAMLEVVCAIGDILLWAAAQVADAALACRTGHVVVGERVEWLEFVSVHARIGPLFGSLYKCLDSTSGGAYALLNSLDIIIISYTCIPSIDNQPKVENV